MKKFAVNFLTAPLLLALSLTAAGAEFPDPARPTVLITGSNANYGLAFVEEYNKLGWNIIATCRTPTEADKLNALAAASPNIVVEELDIMDDAEIAALAEKYRGVPIDVLLNNAAINAYRHGMSTFGNIDYAWFEKILRVNIIGPLKVSEAFQEHVQASKQKTIVALTSTGGSITNQTMPVNVGYSASKAGLNMAMKNLAIYMRNKGVIVSILAPGSIDTEDYMNAADPETVPPLYQRMIKAGRLVPRTAINDMIGLIDRLTLDDSGVYYNWDGSVLPW